MLEDAAGIRRVVFACGTVDLRKGIDATIIGDKYGRNPFEKGTLFLFCSNAGCFSVHRKFTERNRARIVFL